MTVIQLVAREQVNDLLRDGEACRRAGDLSWRWPPVSKVMTFPRCFRRLVTTDARGVPIGAEL